MQPSSLEKYLESADGAGKVLAHAKLLIRLDQIYRTLAPAHLGQASKLANCKSGMIVIHAASGVVAAKLRQLAPTLIDGFLNRGVECNGVQVKVQAWEFNAQSTTSTQKPLSGRTSAELQRLRDSLPQTPLREAVEQLLARAARDETPSD